MLWCIFFDGKRIFLKEMPFCRRMSSLSFISLFPHASIRPQQDVLMRDIHEALTMGKILLAHAPTGLGKTASALSVVLPFALEKYKKIFFLTNRHTQHRIAIDTLQKIKEKSSVEFSCADLIGKRWMCSQDVAALFGNDFMEFCKTIVEKGECEFYNNARSKKDLQVEAKAFVQELQRRGPLHVEEVLSLSKEKRMCSYEVSLALAKKATVLIGDYYYLFNPFVQKTLFTKLELELEDVIVIVDEGHNLPQRIADMVSSNLTTTMIKNSIIEAKKFGYHGLIVWLQEIMRILQNLAPGASGSHSKEKKVTKDEFVNAVNSIVTYDQLVDQVELAAEEVRKKQQKSYLGGISNFLDAWTGTDEGFTRIISEQATKYGPQLLLQYLCLDPAIITKDIFQRVHGGMVMSGTLTPTSMYKDLLGIGNCLEKKYTSPFPPENKLSLVVPETTTKFTLRGDAMYETIAAKCAEMSALIPGNVALFFPSYDLRDRIGYFFKSQKKVFWEKSEMTKEEKEEMLSQFKAAKKEGAVLLGVTGANFAEGVDFPGDLLNGVIVIGIPLAKPDLRTTETIAYYEHKFGRGWDYGYIFPAMNKCIQSAGRCIRSETDKGVIIFLDERFVWQKYFDCLPRERLMVTKSYAQQISQFFK